MDIYEEILRLKQAGRSGAVATIVQCQGSSPQKEGAKMLVVDDREEYANRDNIPDANEFVITDFESGFSNVPIDKNTYLVIATRGHNHDLVALKAALRTEAG